MQADSNALIQWKPPPAHLQLAPDEVHLWCANVATQTFPLVTLPSLLSEDEQRRAARFRFPKDQIQFVVARGCLRLLLGRYLNAPPATLRFSAGAQGKPYLLDEHDAPHALRFNLAHSEALILYAVSWQREVGIDVEFVRAETSNETIAEQFFAPAEVAALRALPLPQQSQAFFHIWTRKEAYLKARGDGLSFPLDGFAVGLAEQAPVQFEVYGMSHESERWRLYSLAPQACYVGAVAIEGQPRSWQCFSTRGLC